MPEKTDKKPADNILNQEIIDGYKKAMALFLNPTEKGSHENILIFLESINDSTMDLRSYFENSENELHSPSHWIAILRFIRVSIALINDIKINYDDFVDSYSKLSALGHPNENEEQLKNEIGNFLYKIDDLIGRQERLLNHLLQEIKNILLDTFGIWDDPAEQFFRTEITMDAMVKVEDDLKSLSQICFELVLELRIMQGLKKLKGLIV